MRSEFKEIVGEVLELESESQANLASEACRDKLVLEIERRVKEKFHIFRINRLLTGD